MNERVKEMAERTGWPEEQCEVILSDCIGHLRCDFCNSRKNLKSKVIDGEEKIVCKSCEDRDHRLHENGKWITDEIVADTIKGHQDYRKLKGKCYQNRLAFEEC